MAVEYIVKPSESNSISLHAFKCSSKVLTSLVSSLLYSKSKTSPTMFANAIRFLQGLKEISTIKSSQVMVGGWSLSLLFSAFIAFTTSSSQS